MPRFVRGLVAAGICLTLCQPACAERRGRLFRNWVPAQPPTTAPRVPPPASPSPTASELYPKYYGSFHYRHLDNVGIPTGDIGLRGNGLYWSPW